jgi:hypothetical protein
MSHVIYYSWRQRRIPARKSSFFFFNLIYLLCMKKFAPVSSDLHGSEVICNFLVLATIFQQCSVWIYIHLLFTDFLHQCIARALNSIHNKIDQPDSERSVPGSTPIKEQQIFFTLTFWNFCLVFWFHSVHSSLQ